MKTFQIQLNINTVDAANIPPSLQIGIAYSKLSFTLKDKYCELKHHELSELVIHLVTHF